MKRNKQNPIMLFVLLLILVSLACSTSQPPTPTPQPTVTATITASPTKTPRPSPTLRPTKTPNLAATQLAEEWNAEAKAYYDKKYINVTNGQFKKLDDYSDSWAQMGWYQWVPLENEVSDFFLSGRFEWRSASKTSDTSGCGFIFGLQSNDDHYAVFLDRTRVLFLMTDSRLGYSKNVGLTRGTGRVKLEGDTLKADFTLIVTKAYAYVLVDGELVGEYTLSQSRPERGNLGFTILSGTNKSYGTYCKMTNLHLWIPKE